MSCATKGWSFVKRHRKWLINPQFDASYDTKAGLVRMSLENDWGFVDKEGEWLINPKFAWAFLFTSMRFIMERNGDMERINRYGAKYP